MRCVSLLHHRCVGSQSALARRLRFSSSQIVTMDAECFARRVVTRRLTFDEKEVRRVLRTTFPSLIPIKYYSRHTSTLWLTDVLDCRVLLTHFALANDINYLLVLSALVAAFVSLRTIHVQADCFYFIWTQIVSMYVECFAWRVEQDVELY